MATITLKGNTLSAYLGGGSFTSVGNAFVQAKQTTNSLINEVNTLSTKIDNASVAANVDTSKQRASNIKTREEKKKSSLTLAYEKLDELISDTGLVDAKVANKVNERKDDFYKKYSYLKPDCEKSDWQLFKEGFKEDVSNLWNGICDIGCAIANLVVDVVEWCAENWQSLVCVIVTIAAAVALVVACVVTFGGAAVLFAVAASVAVSLIGQLVSDTAGFIASGCTEWPSTWEDYVGAVFGGVVEGALSLVPGLKGTPFGGMISSGVQTFFTENLKNLTGRQDKSVAAIFGESATDAALSYIMGEGLEKLSSSNAVKGLKGKMKDGLDNLLDTSVMKKVTGAFSKVADTSVVKKMTNAISGIPDIPLVKNLKNSLSNSSFMKKFSKDSLKSYNDSFDDVLGKLLDNKSFDDFSFKVLGKQIFAETVKGAPGKIRDRGLDPITSFVKGANGKVTEFKWNVTQSAYNAISNTFKNSTVNIIRFGQPHPIIMGPAPIGVNFNFNFNVNFNFNFSFN